MYSLISQTLKQRSLLPAGPQIPDVMLVYLLRLLFNLQFSSSDNRTALFLCFSFVANLLTSFVGHHHSFAFSLMVQLL